MFDFQLVSKLLTHHLSVELNISAAEFARRHKFNRVTFDRLLRNKVAASNVKVTTLCQVLNAAKINLLQVINISALGNSTEIGNLPPALKNFLAALIKVTPEYYQNLYKLQILSYSDQRLTITLTPNPQTQHNNQIDT